MIDIVSPAKRSEMMASIKGRNTKPEVKLRKLLHAKGYRFRLHRRDLSGSPDIVLPKYRTAIFVNGCYWHGHADCARFKLPASNTEFWKNKIGGNKLRDETNAQELVLAGWKVLIIWECALNGKNRIPSSQILEYIEKFLKNHIHHAELPPH